MNKLVILVFVTLIALGSKAQNVGQAGDTLINYVDINGLKQGNWKKTYDNGNLQYEAYFVNDKPVGNLKRYDISGYLTAHLIYDSLGEYATAVFFHRSGDTAATGGYIGKIKNGVWKYFDDKGTFYMQESFKAGVKDGQFLQLTAQGVVMDEINYTDGIENGAWIKRFAEGPIMWQSTYVNGKLEGDTKTYYKSGVLHKEGKFINDLMEGPWKIYSESGNLKKVYQYKKGYCAEAEKEEQERLQRLEDNKDQYVEPNGGDDIDWLRAPVR